MVIHYDLQKINDSLTDFYNSTGINMALFKSDFSHVCENRRHWEKNSYCKAIQNTKKGKDACLESDMILLKKCKETKQAQTHICPAGLVDVAIPILYDGEVIGYILFGQMKPETPFADAESYLTSLGLDVAKMKEHRQNIPGFDSQKIQSISNIASMFIKYLLLENLLKPGLDDRTQAVVNYIDQNLHTDFSIQSIAKNVNLSKNVLYRLFRNSFDCTVSEYINKRRIEKSLPFLTETDLSIEEISQKVGFSSVSYYGRIFKKMKHQTPLAYKKLHKQK